jgi:hypothetical protein
MTLEWGLSTTAIGEFLAEVDRAVEAQASVVVNVNVQRFEVSWSVDDSNLAGLYEVVCINQKEPDLKESDILPVTTRCF